MTNTESITLKYIRVCSMLAIIICHICETYSQSNKYGYIFNVGVQVFIALSGYLYGKKHIDNWKQWTLKRIKRIYLPMALFLILVLPLYLLFHRDVFGWKVYALNYLNLQGFMFVLGGGYVVGYQTLMVYYRNNDCLFFNSNTAESLKIFQLNNAYSNFVGGYRSLSKT